MCASTLLSFHQLYIICQSNNSRFIQSLEGDAYEHHVVKNHVVGDTSELLELQSSFSREIENEILNMHESKEINEAESEIAANAAVKELERIGSAENISLVEETDVLNSIAEDKEDPLNQKKTDESSSKTVPDELSIRLNDANIDIEIETEVEAENKIRSKSKKEPLRKQKNDEKPKTNSKSRTAKTPKKAVKSPKAEILKENIARSKNSKIEKNTQTLTDDKDVKENSFVENGNQK